MAGDVLGTCIDRCARIAKIAAPRTAVASDEFVKSSTNHQNWRRIGQFAFKGLPAQQIVYQLKDFGQVINIPDSKLWVASSGELIEEVLRLRGELEECWKQLRLSRRRQ